MEFGLHLPASSAAVHSADLIRFVQIADNLGFSCITVADDYIKAFREPWTRENLSFDGKYCIFSAIIFLPTPVQKPAIPIWIGGHSKRALRRAGELGDGWHPIGGVPTIPLEPEEVARDL